MADQSDVRRISMALPETSEGQDRFSFSVRNRAKEMGFAWVWMERVHPKKPRVPNHEVLAVRVADQDVKAIVLESDPEIFFTEPHYNGFPAVLVRLPKIGVEDLKILITDAWRCRAPRILAEEFERIGAAAKPGEAL